MILDASLILGDGQSTTTNEASTDYIDTLAAGNDVTGCWFNVRIGTPFVAKNGAPQIAFQLQTSNTSTFPTASTTLLQSGTFLVAGLTANSLVYKARIPPGALRYIRGYKKILNYSAGAQDVSAGSYDMFITKDSDITRDPQ